MISCLKKKKRLRCPLPSLPCGCWVLSVGLGEALGPRGLEGGCCVCEKARDGGGAKGTGSLALGEAPVRVFPLVPSPSLRRPSATRAPEALAGRWGGTPAAPSDGGLRAWTRVLC